MKAILLSLAMTMATSNGWAYDCSKSQPFPPMGEQTVKVTVSKFSWDHGQSNYEDVCSTTLSINSYDVRGREEEAYYCLKPSVAEIVICKTQINNESAEVEILPASWIRTWQISDMREYRFHAYVVKDNDPDFYYDIFSRVLSLDLKPQNLILEGSLKTGPSNPGDGFWIRTEFQK